MDLKNTLFLFEYKFGTTKTQKGDLVGLNIVLNLSPTKTINPSLQTFWRLNIYDSYISD